MYSGSEGFKIRIRQEIIDHQRFITDWQVDVGEQLLQGPPDAAPVILWRVAVQYKSDRAGNLRAICAAYGENGGGLGIRRSTPHVAAVSARGYVGIPVLKS